MSQQSAGETTNRTCSNQYNNQRQQPRCFKCNKLGHIALKCPENKESQEMGQEMACFSGHAEALNDNKPVEYRAHGIRPVDRVIAGHRMLEDDDRC